MLANNACVARGHFRDTRGTWLLVHVPTRSFFRLHNIDPNASRIWASLSLQGSFELESWGPKFGRAWEALTTLTDRFRCRVTDFEGHPREIHLTRELVQWVWNVTEGQLTYHDRTHTDEDCQRCSASSEHPTWDGLHHH